MKETLNTVRVGLFFLLGVAITWIVYETLQEGAVFESKGFTIVGEFQDVKLLRSGDDVRIAGVRVGRVRETRLKGAVAEAVLEIESEIQIPSDSIATIAMSSLLGTNHVAIEIGSASTKLSNNDRIKTDHTADLNEIFAKLGGMSERIDGLFDNLGSTLGSIAGTDDEPGVFENLNQVLNENRGALKETMENIRDISAKINSGEGTIARLINDSDAYDRLMGAVDEIAKAAENASELTDGANDIIAHIQSGQGTLGNLVYGEAENLSDLIFSEKTREDVEALASNLRQLSDRLANGEGTLGRLLTDDALYNDLEAILKKAERTFDGLNEQGPITAVGVAAGALF